MEVGSRGPHGKKFFLYFCSFSAQTPPENVRAAIDAVHMYNRGERPYAGIVETGPGFEDVATMGGKGFMGIGVGEKEATDYHAGHTDDIFSEIYKSVMDFDED